MLKLFSLLAATVATGIFTAAVAEDRATYEATTKVERDADGDYTQQTKEKRSDPTGSSTVETKTELDVDTDGDSEKTVTTKAVSDPKGMFNKTKTTKKDTVKSEDGKTTVKHEKKVDGKVVEDTESSAETRPAE